MRVAYIGDEIPDHCIHFADMMADRCDVLLCIPNKYFTNERARSIPRLQIAWLPWPRKRDLRNIIFMWTLVRRIRRWKPDVVHFLSESNVWNWLLVRFLGSTPIITTVHDLKIHPGDADARQIPRVFANALIKQSDAIIVHGETIRQEAIGNLPIKPDQIYVVPLVSPLLPDFDSSGIDAREGNTKPNDGVFRILFFGRIYEYKGLRYLLEAMPLVGDRVKNVRLTIAGQGDDIAKYSDYIADPKALDIRNRFIPQDEVTKLFVEADLLALPYIEASQSGPLMIAMAFGLPVVATDVGEIANVVRSTDMGLVVPPKDKSALADAICKIATDQKLIRAFSANATSAMEGDYSRRAISVRVERIYQGLINISAA